MARRDGSAATTSAGIPPEGSTGVAGVVLAGGRSSRMGTDKAALVLGSGSLRERAVGLLREALGPGARVVVSGGVPGALAVPDLEPDRGPLGGIRSVAEALPGARYLVVVPVDMPLLRAEDLGLLLGTVRAPGGPRAAHFRSSFLPAAIRRDADFEKVLDGLLQETRGASVGALLGRLDAQSVADAGSGRLFNVNTPGDWERVRGHESQNL